MIPLPTRRYLFVLIHFFWYNNAFKVYMFVTVCKMGLGLIFFRDKDSYVEIFGNGRKSRVEYISTWEADVKKYAIVKAKRRWAFLRAATKWLLLYAKVTKDEPMAKKVKSLPRGSRF